MIRRGQLWFCNNPSTQPNVQQGNRPVIIVSNDVINETSSVVLVVPCTRQVKRNFPTHTLFISQGDVSVALTEQLQAVNVNCLTSYLGDLDDYIMSQLEHSMLISLGIISTPYAEELKASYQPFRRPL